MYECTNHKGGFDYIFVCGTKVNYIIGLFERCAEFTFLFTVVKERKDWG